MYKNELLPYSFSIMEHNIVHLIPASFSSVTLKISNWLCILLANSIVDLLMAIISLLLFPLHEVVYHAQTPCIFNVVAIHTWILNKPLYNKHVLLNVHTHLYHHAPLSHMQHHSYFTHAYISTMLFLACYTTLVCINYNSTIKTTLYPMHLNS